MDVLNICRHDYANYMRDITQAMRSVGIDVQEAKKHTHEFGYEEETPVRPHQEIVDMIRQAKIIQIFHSDLQLLTQVQSLNPRAKRVIYHTGTLYRQRPDHHNRAIDPMTKVVMALGEFMELGARHPIYMAPTINTNRILPRDGFIEKNPNKRRLIGHFPSSRTNKGSELIERLMIEHKDVNYVTSGTLIPHADHLKRIQEVDILIELFNPTQGGKKYGSWGMTCLEAAAMAKVVITQNLSDKVYQDHYGPHPLKLIRNPHEFHQVINELRDMSAQDLLDLQISTWKWVHQNHGYVPTGNYIKNKIINL